jgi:uncharacterized protein DUF4249
MTRITFTYLFVILISLVIFSCEEVIVIDIDQAPPQLVIDGLVTDEDTVHKVRITKSAGFYGESGENVANADVEVADNFGNVYNYTHNPQGYDSLQGYYFSDQRFAGIVNGVYELRVTLANQTFIGRDTLRPITPIDSLSIRVDTHAVDNPDNDGKIYQVLLYAQEPQATVDFYYFKFYRDSLIEDEDNNIYVFDDKVLGSSLNGLPSPILFREGELASVEIYSLTRQQFVYLTDLASLLHSDGGMFSPPPANPRNNISGGVLGLFQVSGINRASILIEP